MDYRDTGEKQENMEASNRVTGIKSLQIQSPSRLSEMQRRALEAPKPEARILVLHRDRRPIMYIILNRAACNLLDMCGLHASVSLRSTYLKTQKRLQLSTGPRRNR